MSITTVAVAGGAATVNVSWGGGPAPDTDAPVLVAGGPGTGRSTRARAMAQEPVSVLTAASALLDGSDAWARDFASMVRSGQGTVCVDGLDLLADRLLQTPVAAGRDAGEHPLEHDPGELVALAKCSARSR